MEKDMEKDVEKGVLAGDETGDAAANPNIVNWDGPDDPANPHNWSHVYKLVNIWLISLSVLYVNLATTMFSRVPIICSESLVSRMIRSRF